LVVVTLDGVRRSPVISVGSALIGFVFLEVLRIWFPSVLFVAGDAGTTSAVWMAAFGLACLGLAPALASLPVRIRPVLLWRLGAGAVLAGRAALTLQHGGAGRLAASTAVVVGATLAIVALAAGVRAGRTVRVGLFAGVVASTCLHVVTRTRGLVWPDTTATTATSIGVLVVLALAVVRTDRELTPDAAASAPATSGGGAAWPWLTLTPMLVLVGVISGVPGRMAVATGWSSSAVAATIAAAHLAALIAAAVARRIGPARAGLLAAAGIAGGTAAALDAAGWSGVLGQIVLVLGIGLLLGSDLGTTVRAASDRRRGVAAGSAVLAFGAVTAVYYAAYDVALPFDNRVLLLATGALGAGLALATSRSGRAATVRATLDLPRFAQRLVIATVIVGLVFVAARPPEISLARATEPDVLRVVTYNVRFGFDLDGRFAAREQARLLRGLAPDVVVLNEVDRGWLTTGGHDALEIIAAEVGLPHVMFAPAADEVWGNALLSRHPIDERASESLPPGADPMERGQLVAVLDLGDDRQLGVVGTHLSHLDDEGDTRLPQARAVAATVAVLGEREVPTVVLGDLNAGPGSAALGSFARLMRNVLPEGTSTYPADTPTEHLDHVLATSELRPVETVVPEVTFSDHRPVVVDLRLTPAS
jgi:endonuclease/exonuclease/phosphatase family metal-dependent hydrolase